MNGNATHPKYLAYLRQRQQLDERLLAVTERYEKALLTLSGGAIAISLTFLEKIAIAPTAASVPVMGLSWLFLVFAVLLGFVSIYFSSVAVERARAENEDDYANFLRAESGSGEGCNPPPDRARLLSTYIKRCSFAATACLVAGLFLLCTFATLNLFSSTAQGERSMPDLEHTPLQGPQGQAPEDTHRGSYTPERQEQGPPAGKPGENGGQDQDDASDGG